MTDDRIVIAEKLKRLLIASSPLIEEYTNQTCPGCTDVCCMQKHGLFREKDILYLHAIGVEVPPPDGVRPLEGPCQFMGPRGCVQPRWLRPFKCTWYFCEPLLAALHEGPQKKARRLSAVLQEMIDLYRELPDE
jgi:hypothetical protein